MPTIARLYSLTEIQQHASREDCWIVVDGKKDGILERLQVYNVTNYLDDHPGGDDVILDAAGKDATEEFEDAGHSKSARELMNDYLIGEVDVIQELEIARKELPSIFDFKFLDKSIQFWAFPLALAGVSAVAAGLLLLRKK